MSDHESACSAAKPVNYIGHRGLWCRIGAVTFPNANTVMLHLHPGDCTDMSGAIKLATALARDLEGFSLRVVHAVSPGEPKKDSVYRLQEDGTWKSVGRFQ